MYKPYLKTGKPDHNRKGCEDCKHLGAAISWWCTNEKAIKYRKTKLPNAENCLFWDPCPTEQELLKNFKKIPDNYISVDSERVVVYENPKDCVNS